VSGEIEYHVDISELHRMATLVPQMAGIIEQEVEKAMVDSGMALTTLVASRIGSTSKNTGLLQAAVSFPEGFTTEGSLSSVYTGTVAASGKKVSQFGVAASIYANYVEFGTRAHWPPSAPLEYWVTRKWGLSGDDARAAAWWMCMQIAKRGTYAKGNFFLAWHYDGGKDIVKRIWAGVPSKVAKRWNEGDF
jgi:hypothetical protein